MLGIRRYPLGAVHDRTGLYDFFVRRAVTQKSRTEPRPPLPSALVWFLLSINHRLALGDVSYEPAGQRGGAGLLFFGISRGRGAANVLSKVVVMPLMTMATIHHRRRRSVGSSSSDHSFDASKTPCPSRAEEIQTR